MEIFLLPSPDKRKPDSHNDILQSTPTNLSPLLINEDTTTKLSEYAKNNKEKDLKKKK